MEKQKSESLIMFSTKVNSDYYINNILKPFLDKEWSQIVSQWCTESIMFHQDSPSGHTVKYTLDIPQN